MSNELQSVLDDIKLDKQTNLKPENIKKDITVLGVTGTLEDLDTSDATATANDIINPKTAYVNNRKIIGNIIPTYKTISNAVVYSSILQNGGSSYLTIGFAPDNSFLIELDYVKQALVVKDSNLNIVKEESISSFVPDYTVSYDGRLYISISVAGVQNNVDCHYVFVSLNDYKSFITVFNYKTKEFNYINSGYAGFYPIVEDWNIGVCPGHTYFSEINPNLALALIHDGNNYKRPYCISLNNDGTSSYTDLLGGNTHQGNDDHLLNITPAANGKVLQFLYTSNGWNYNNTSTTLRRCLAYMNTNNTGFSYVSNVNYIFSPSGMIATDGINIYDCIFDVNSKTFSVTERFSLGNTYNVLYFINETTFIAWSTNQNIKLFKLNLDTNSISTYDYVLDNPLSLSSTVTKNKLNIISTTYRTLTIDTQDILISMERDNVSYINTSDADTSASDIVSGKVAYNANGKIIGTMLNNGELNYTPSSDEQIIPAGYTSGGTIAASPVSQEEYDECVQYTSVIMTGRTIEFLNYIKSNGSQHIDLGIKYTPTTKIVLDIEPVGSRNWQMFMSDSGNNDSHLFALQDCTQNNGGGFDVWLNNDTARIRYNINQRLTVTFDRNKFYVNDTLYKTFNSDTWDIPNNITLFNNSTMSLYNCKVYDNDILIMDLHPAVDTLDNNPTLFDIVSDNFISNSGTGKFIGG